MTLILRRLLSFGLVYSCLVPLAHCSGVTKIATDVTPSNPAAQTDPVTAFDLRDDIARAMDEVTGEILRSIRLTQGLIPNDGNHESGDRRQRRDTSAQNEEAANSAPVQRLTAIQPLFSICDHAVHVSTKVFNGMTIAVCISGGPRPAVTIGELSLSALKFTARASFTDVRQPVESAVFEHRANLYVMVADSARRDGVPMLKINDKFELSTEHVVHCAFPTSVVVWKPNSDGPYHMAIASSPDPRPRLSTYRSETSFYTFRDTYFDHYTSVNTFLVKDLCPFSDGGKDYIVVVNSEETPKPFGTQVDSELYRFDADNKKWISIQKIKTTGGVACEVFSMGSAAGHGRDSQPETFLAIANQKDRTPNGINLNVDSVVYKFANERFVPFQCLKTVNATSIKAINTEAESGRFALAVSHLYGVQMYQYNGWKFVPSATQLTRGAMGRGVSSLTTAILGPEPVIIVSNPVANREKSVIKFQFKEYNVLEQWRKDSLRWCETVRSVSVKRDMDRLEKSLDTDVFLVDQKDPIRIRGNVDFNGDVDVNGVFSAPAVHNLEENEFLNHTKTRELDELDNMLKRLEAQTAATVSLLEKALRLDRPHQVVTGQYHFNNELELACGTGPMARPVDACRFGVISTRTLNGKDVHNLADEVIRIDRDLVINRNDFFFKHMEVTKDLNVIANGLVNGVNISQVVTKSGSHVIEGATVISGPVSASDMSVSGRINGLVINNNTVLLKRGDQTIRSNLIFKSKLPDTLVAQTLFVKSVNNLQLDKFLSTIVTKDGNHVITGSKRFKSIVVNENLDLQLGSLLSGVDVNDLWNNVLWNHGDQVVRAPRVTLASLSVRGDLNVESGLINGQRVPNGRMVLNRAGAPIVISAQKTFSAPVTRVDHMHVEKSLNGLTRVIATDESLLSSEWPEQLDILIKSLSQTVSGHKTFSGPVHLGGHSSVEGEVNGMDLSQWQRSVLKHSQSNILSGQKVWTLEGSVTFKQGVTVKGLVDGVNITDLYVNSLKLNDAIVHSFAQGFHFSHVHSSTLKCSRVNGLVLDRDLITLHTKQSIAGVKSFPKGLHVSRDFTVSGTLNGLSLRFLNESLLRSVNQMVWGPKVINGDLHVTNLVTSTINGVDLFNDLILINSTKPQIVTGKKTLKTMTVGGDLNVKSLDISGKLNGITFPDLVQNTLLYDEPQVVTGLKHFDSLKIPAGSNLRVETMNGYKLTELVRDAVLIDIPQNITGNKVFKSPEIRFRDLRFSALFDGVSDAVMRGNWLLQGVDQEVRGDLVFGDAAGPLRHRQRPTIIVKGNLIVANGTINNIDLRALDHNILKVNEAAVIQSPVTFNGRVIADGDIAVAGKVQGVKLSQDAVLRSSRTASPIRIYGLKTFRRNVLVRGDLHVRGFVDGVLISDMCNNAVRINGNQEIRAPVTVRGSVRVVRHLTTGGRVDEVNVRALQNSCVMRSGSEQVIHGNKHFKTLILSAPSVVRGLFGGIDLHRLQKDYMSLTRNQVVTTRLVLLNGANFASKVEVLGNVVTRDGLIWSGKPNFVVDLKQVDKNTLKTDGDQDISGRLVFKNDVHFAKNVYIKKTAVNGMPFDWFLSKNKPKQVVHTPLVFDDVKVDRNLELVTGARVQETDVSHVRRSQVPITGGTDIWGQKRFSAIEVDHLIVTGRLNGLQFNERTVLLSGEKAKQVISGSLAFEKDVTVQSTLNTKRVNGVDLVSLRARLVYNGLQTNDTIYGRKVYLGKVTSNQTWAMSLVNGVKINDLNAAVADKRYLEELKSVQQQLDFQESKLRKMDHVLEKQLNCVDHYALSHTMDGSLMPSVSRDRSLIFTRSEGQPSCASINVYQMPSRTMALIAGLFNPRVIADFSLGSRKMVAVFSAPVSVNAPVCGSPLPANAIGVSVASVFTLEPTVGHLSAIPLTLAVTAVTIASLTPSEVCLIVTGFKETQVLCLDHNGKVVHTKTSPVPVAGVAVVRVDAEERTLAAVGMAGTVRIADWNPSSRYWDQSPLQQIRLQTPELGSDPVMHFTSARTWPVFLIVAEPKSKRIRQHKALIRIFRHDTRVASVIPFTETQQLPESDDVQAIESLSTGSDLLLFVLLQDKRIRVMRLEGASGFMDADLIDVQPISSESVLSVSSVAGGSHAVAVSGRRRSADGRREVSVTNVLIAVTRNRYSLPFIAHKPWN